jgi:alkyl sulfatase BDS1-like metallo-beta-lactamase superfamily hydrolase
VRFSFFQRHIGDPAIPDLEQNLIPDPLAKDSGVWESPCAQFQPSSCEPRIERVGEHVYCAIGYALANVAMIAVDGGKVIVDATESVRAARAVKSEFDKLVPGPVKAIIFTHSHPDHILGASVFQEPGAEIWAQENFSEELRTQMGILSRTVRRRASKQFGESLPSLQAAGGGIGPALRLDLDAVPPILFPTRTFRGRTELKIGGVRFDLEEAPGETRDHLFVHLPQEKIVLAGDNLYRAFPNLHAIRGAPPRPVRFWIQSLDKIRVLEPEFLVLGHTEPIRGGEQVREIMTAYRDAIAYLHATVLRRTNEGSTPDELAATVQLPEHLRHHPYLQESYGKISWAVRGIYEGYLGWFDGNATNLQRLPQRKHAEKFVELCGGIGRVEQAIQDSLTKKDFQWSAELCDLLLAVSPHHDQGRLWKAQSLEMLGQRETNVLARNFYFASALELRGLWSTPQRAPITSETLKHVPMDLFIQSLPLRLRPDRTAELTMQIGFEFTDSGKQFTLYIRRGVGEVRPDVLDQPAFVVSGHEKDFKALASGRAAAARAALLGTLRCSGGWRKLRFLRSILDPP